jgi:DNA-binding NtrC family response regulator
MSGRILVVDDEVGIRELLSEILTDEGYEVSLAQDAAEARAFRRDTRPDLVLLDIWMPDIDGVSLLKEWASGGLLTMPVVMMSGHASLDIAMEATRLGAVDFLEKPIALAKLLDAVGRAIRKGGAAPRAQPSMDLDALGKSATIQNFKRHLSQLARNTAPVLLTGDAGSGFEICARSLLPAGSPWVVLDDPARLVNEPGHYAELAGAGIVFLHELGDLEKLEQKGLLILIERLEKQGGRLVAASHQDLAAMTASGALDSRLYYRVAAFTLHVPGMREHREDVPDIAARMLSELIEADACPPRRFSVAALNALRHFDWPGNLPQLNAAVRTAAVTASGMSIEQEDVERALAPFRQAQAPASLGPVPLDVPLREARDAFEREYLTRLIQLEQGNISRVADRAGLERTHLYRKLKQLDVPLPRKGAVEL